MATLPDKHSVLLTEDQLTAVRTLFDQNNWTLEITQARDDQPNTRRSGSPTRQINDTDETSSGTRTRDNTVIRKVKWNDTPDEYVALKDMTSGVRPDDNRETSPEGYTKTAAVSRTRSTGDSVKRGIDKNDTSFQSIRDVGSQYHAKLRSSTKQNDVTVNNNVTKEMKQKWRRTGLDTGGEYSEVSSNLEVNHHVVKSENKVKIVTSLSTEHIHEVSRVPVRIVLVVDRSGSMLNKIGKGSRYPKITNVKHFACKLVSTLDDGDEAAIVTFGDEAQIFFPLVKINSQSRRELSSLINKLDKGSMSQKTDLSQGLKMALKVFHDATKSPSDYIKTKNSILILTDGDVNAGITEPIELVHQVRSNIRQMVPTLDESINQWVTISAVTTGSSVSEQIYLLSKTCSSEAYYYIDSDNEDPEAELFLPVLMRKSAVVWNVSCIIDAFHGITFVDSECTQDYHIRIRRSRTAVGKSGNNTKAFFLYDLPLGSSRSIGLGAALPEEEEFYNLREDVELFRIRVEYTNIDGERFWLEKSVTFSDIVASEMCASPADLNAMYMHDMRTASTAILRKAADCVKNGDARASKAAILDGQHNIQKLLEDIRQKQTTSYDTSEGANMAAQITGYTRSVVENMGALVNYVESHSSGQSWNKMKAVSTAIARESPNISDAVQGSAVLCPLPTVSAIGKEDQYKGDDDILNPMEALLAKQAASVALNRIQVGDLDSLLEDMKKSLP